MDNKPGAEGDGLCIASVNAEGQSEIETSREEKPAVRLAALGPLSARVSYGQLFAFGLAFVLGAVVFFLFQNVGRSEILTFSTASLVGFVFSVVLSGASIILSFTTPEEVLEKILDVLQETTQLEFS